VRPQDEGPYGWGDQALLPQWMVSNTGRVSSRPHRFGQDPVLVGIDGSPGGQEAACLGAWEASRRGCPLLLVHGAHVPLAGLASAERTSAAHDAGRQMLIRTELRTHASHPTVHIRSTVVTGSPAGAIVELSARASLVVVGARGTGGFGGLRIGTVAAQVARHAHAPVIVVRPPADGAVDDLPCAVAPRAGGVVAGVDGSAASAAVLDLAFEEAEARRVPLTVVYAWWMLPLHGLGPTAPWHYDPDQAATQARRMLAETLAGWAEKYPDVEVHAVARHDINPVLGLIEASRDAGLLVVGSRGRGGFAGLLLGSVSQSLVEHALCPVAVVRARDEY
jgi:nucleotide-binding universal stress UspA family protein